MTRLLSILALFFLPAALLAAPGVSVDELSRAMERDRLLFPELSAVTHEAAARGLRVYLLGGGAASLAHFSKQRLLFEKEGRSIAPNDGRFAYLYNSLLLPGQDLDLVITRKDGRPETAAEIASFRAFVRKELPYENDGKSRWDVLGLRTADPGAHKLALEGNPDFLKQHNDGYSLALVELTDPPVGEPFVKELGGRKEFLQDVAEGRLHFHFSPDHGTTKFFREGRNPPILSAVRALEKSFRYGVEIDPAGMEKIREIVRGWDPSKEKRGSYTHGYLTGRASRLVAYAQDPEAALARLSDLGLKEKLEKLPGESKHSMGSLSWWLNKKPLPRASVGPDEGRTAAELGITRVEHRTSLLGHRLITANADGTPRLFQSRENTNGENAAHGEGFYTIKAGSAEEISVSGGEKHVFFRVKPEAREGRDFKAFPDSAVVIFKNSAFLELEPSLPIYGFQLPCEGLYSNFAVRSSTPSNLAFLGSSMAYGMVVAAGVGGTAGLVYANRQESDDLDYRALFRMDLPARKARLGRLMIDQKTDVTCSKLAGAAVMSLSSPCPLDNLDEYATHAALLVGEQEAGGMTEYWPARFGLGARYDARKAYDTIKTYGRDQTRCLDSVFGAGATIASGTGDWLELCGKMKSPEQAALVEALTTAIAVKDQKPRYGWYEPVLDLGPERALCARDQVRNDKMDWHDILANCPWMPTR